MDRSINLHFYEGQAVLLSFISSIRQLYVRKKKTDQVSERHEIIGTGE